MFSDKKNKKSALKKEINLIRKGTSLIGDIISEDDFRIDGTIEGTVKTSGRVVIGKEGVVKGKAFCNSADIEGTFSGELEVKSLLSLKSSAVVYGNIVIGKLMVEPGAVFNASCMMREREVKELVSNEQNRIEKQQKSKAS